MSETKDNMIDLVTDYLTGQATPDDERQLLAWIAESDRHRQLFLEWREMWLGTDSNDANRFDCEAAYQSFLRQRITPEEAHQRNRRLHANYFRVRDVYRWAAVIFFPVLIVWSVCLYLYVSRLSFGEVRLTTEEGQESTLLLPDGSKVELSGGSAVSYNASDFAHGTRAIQFVGRAVFHIQGDSLHPFTIETDDEVLRVLGTTFIFLSPPGDAFHYVSLEKGVVEFSDKKTGQQRTITTGDMLTHNLKTQKIYARHYTPEEYAQVRMLHGGTAMDPIVIERYDRTEDGYDFTLVFNQHIKPGSYEVHMSKDKSDIDMEPNVPDAHPFQAGSGTAADPYIITNARQMQQMRAHIPLRRLTYFALGDDIDLKGINWQPLNDYIDDFDHWIVFDGRHHVIRNLSSNHCYLYGSFFGVLCGACRNVGFENASASSSNMSAGIVAGCLGHAGYPGNTVVENCYVQGSVSANGSVGGIAGELGGRAEVRGCSADVEVTSVSAYAGGLIGRVGNGLLSMSRCIVCGEVSGQYAGGVIAGGQDSHAAASSYTDLLACNRSVHGGISAHVLGQTLSGDTLRGALFANTILVNGHTPVGGQPLNILQQHASRWPKAWYEMD